MTRKEKKCYVNSSMDLLFTTSKLRIPISNRGAIWRYPIAAGTVLVTTALRWGMERYYPPHSPFILSYLAVMVAVWYGGLGPGLFAIGFSLILENFHPIPPYFGWSFLGPSRPMQAMLFVFVSAVICLLTDNLRRALLENNQNAHALLQSQKKIVDIIESVQGFFFSVDERGRLLHLNERCRKMLPSDGADFLGKDPWEVFPQWAGSVLPDGLRDAMARRRGAHFEFFEAKEGHWYEAHLSPSAEGISVHLFDISARKEEEAKRLRMEEELRLSNEALEQRVAARTSQLAQANEGLVSEMQERQKVEKEALEIIQDEQRRFSAQLHDGACQELTGILMMVKALARRLETGATVDGSEVKKVAQLVENCVTELRDLARGLYPVELETDSLMRSLRDLASRTEKLYHVNCKFYCPSPILLTDNVAATHLYRITQEAISNAINHGGAKHLQLGLLASNGNIVLSVQDDGKGLGQEKRNSPGIGLQIMRFRARILDATLRLEDLPEGALFTCSFPVEGRAAESSEA